MNDEPGEQVRGRRQRVSLANLYLDPNNYRFADHPDYSRVAPEEVFRQDVQRRTMKLVLGDDLTNVDDLRKSIKENGWLDLDPILVQRHEDGGRFLVVEGNRRVATLKHLRARYDEGAIDLGRLDPALFTQLPVVLHEAADERQHLVMMGLHHISGKRRWLAVNRALAMKQLLDHFDGDSDAVCRALGVTKQDFNRSIRTLALVDAYKESDFGDQFRPDQYSLFREVLGKPPIRRWLGWNNATSEAAEQDNLHRLFGWMSSVASDDEGDEDDGTPAGTDAGPVVTTIGHVRELAKLIEDPKALERLDDTRSLQEATLSSDLLTKTEVNRAFLACDDGIQRLHRQVGDLDSEDLDRVEQIIGQLHGLSIARKRRPALAGERLPWQPFNELPQCQFDDINVDAYRGIDGLELHDLRRINLIAGVNNAGKTSVLEAIHLLAHQNDETALLGALRWRGRLEEEPDPVWLVEQIQPRIRIDGHFDSVPENAASLTIQRVDDPGNDIKDQTSFLARLLMESRYGGQTHTSDVALFSDRPHRTHFEGRHWLCRSALTSSFGANRGDALMKANEAALEAGTKAKVIDFIKEHVDAHMTNIELADEQRRFLVSHSDFERAPDLSSFGDGLRRVFEIGLLFANVQGGVLLIDEFETAIHRKLLVAFTSLVQELAVEHNVQVFLTTHSKEAIDAFVTNNYRTEDIAAYAIQHCPAGADARRFDGSQLLLLNEAADFDLRGVK